MRTILTALLTTFATQAYAETVVLSCAIFNEPSSENSRPLYFETDKKMAAFSIWSPVKTTHWSQDKIVWAQVNEKVTIAGLFVYDRNEDLLMINTISKHDFWNGMNGIKEPVNEPYRCKRRSF